MKPTPLAWIPFGIAAVTNLVALAADADAVAAGAQIALMPALAGVVVTSGIRTRTTGWLLAALAGSWLGDTLPKVVPGDYGFIVMVAGFMLAQIAYIIGFLPRWRESVVRKPVALLPYLAVIGTLVAVCAPRARRCCSPSRVTTLPRPRPW